MNNNLPDKVINYLIQLIEKIDFLVPSAVCILAIWRVARLRNLTLDNYREKVDESVADTLKEQISDRFLDPIFQQQGIPLPRGTRPSDLLERLVAHDPNNLSFLTQIYDSFSTF